MGLRHMASDWEIFDLDLLREEEEDHADLVSGIQTDDGQAMGEHHCTP